MFLRKFFFIDLTFYTLLFIHITILKFSIFYLNSAFFSFFHTLSILLSNLSWQDLKNSNNLVRSALVHIFIFFFTSPLIFGGSYVKNFIFAIRLEPLLGQNNIQISYTYPLLCFLKTEPYCTVFISFKTGFLHYVQYF